MNGSKSCGFSVPSSLIRTAHGCKDPSNQMRICPAMTKTRLPPILMRDNSTYFALKQSGTMISDYHAT
jgi:hypothetical protein